MLKSDIELCPMTYSIKSFRRKKTSVLKKVMVVSAALAVIAVAVGFVILHLSRMI